ncbi:hypothetical protein [Roseovarius sp.]|uniref:hypothetical protein n=1 Tax=Roseovarius sp. TaxID=1486281 RepID=UPI00356642AB
MIEKNPFPLQEATFADLLSALPELYEKPATRRDYRYAIQRCAEIYGVKDLKDLPLESPETFDRRFPRNGFSPDQPFVSEGSYGAWRRKVRAPLQKYLDPDTRNKRQSAPDDDWMRLLTTAPAEAERLGIPPQKLISLRILAQEARGQDIQPNNLSPALIERLTENLTARRRKSFRTAFPLLERLRTGSSEIASYLPSTQLLPPSTKSNAAPLHLLAEAEAWVSEHCRGEYDEIEERHEGESSEETRKAYLAAFRNYLDISAASDLITRRSTLSEAMSKTIFLGVMRRWIKLSSSGSIKPRSMSDYIRSIRMIARERGLDVKHMTDGLKTNRQLKEGKKAGQGMAERPKTFCHWLLSDKKNQNSFMSLHIRFFKSAERLLQAEQYRTLTKAEQDHLRQLGTLAAMAAIWLWIAPLRITNLMGLTISGPQRKLHLPDEKRGYAMLLIPGHETKTGRPIRKKVHPNRSRALEVIEFYMTHIRPRYPYASASPLLFPGHEDASVPIHKVSIRTWLKRECRSIGFYPISPHWFRHGVASIFLKHNPGANVHAGRMLDDMPRTVRSHYGFIDDEQLHDETQMEMLRIAGFTDEEPQAPSSLRVKW